MYAKTLPQWGLDYIISLHAVKGIDILHGNKYNYFKLYNTDDSALFVDYVSFKVGTTQYIGYEYSLSEDGDITKIFSFDFGCP